MAKKRLALVACKDASEGPWTRAKGNEVGLEITELGEGEYIRLHLEVGELSEYFDFYKPGVFPLPFRRTARYRVSKIVTQGRPTTVEVLLDEQT